MPAVWKGSKRMRLSYNVITVIIHNRTLTAGGGGPAEQGTRIPRACTTPDGNPILLVRLIIVWLQ